MLVFMIKNKHNFQFLKMLQIVDAFLINDDS